MVNPHNHPRRQVLLLYSDKRQRGPRKVRQLTRRPMDSKWHGLNVKQTMWDQRSYALVAGLCQVRAHLLFTLLTIAEQTIEAEEIWKDQF